MDTVYSSATSERSNTSSRGLMVSAAVCALLLAVLIPVFSWIRLVNQDTLFSAMGMKKSAVASVEALGNGFSVFHFLAFVQYYNT